MNNSHNASNASVKDDSHAEPVATPATVSEPDGADVAKSEPESEAGVTQLSAVVDPQS